MKLKIFRFVSAALLLGWMILIFVLSNETAAVSSQTSGGFSKALLSIFYPPFRDLAADRRQEMIEGISHIIRKSAHFTIYGILGCLSFITVLGYRLNIYIRCTVALLICVFYAAGDEWHQTFIAGRSGELRDVLLDSLGALLFIAAAAAIVALNRRLRGAFIRNAAFPERRSA